MARQSRGRRTDLQWDSILIKAEMRSLSSVNTFGDSSTFVTFNQPGTLMRTRGAGTVVMDPGAAGDEMVVGLGLIIVQSDAVVAGAGSVPSPIEDAEAPWIWLRHVPLASGDASAQNGADVNQADRFEIDSKAMRKIKPGQTMTFVMDGVISGGTPSATVSLITRCLVGT